MDHAVALQAAGDRGAAAGEPAHRGHEAQARARLVGGPGGDRPAAPLQGARPLRPALRRGVSENKFHTKLQAKLYKNIIVTFLNRK